MQFDIFVYTISSASLGMQCSSVHCPKLDKYNTCLSPHVPKIQSRQFAYCRHGSFLRQDDWLPYLRYQFALIPRFLTGTKMPCSSEEYHLFVLKSSQGKCRSQVKPSRVESSLLSAKVKSKLVREKVTSSRLVVLDLSVAVLWLEAVSFLDEHFLGYDQGVAAY